MRRTTKLFLVLAMLSGCTDPDIRRGDEALAHGRYPEAIAFYEQARTRHPEAPEPKRGIASAHRAHAATLVSEGKCEEARDHVAKAEALTAPVLVDHQELARCLTAQNGPPEAQVEQLARLVVLGDTRASVLRNLMGLELDLGRDADAVSRAALLEGRAELSVAERRRLVDALLRVGKPVDAAAHIEHILLTDPLDALLRLKRAELLEAGSRMDDAKQAYVALTTDFPRNPVVHIRLAEFLRRRGDEAGARLAQLEADRLQGIAPVEERNLRPLRKSRR